MENKIVEELENKAIYLETELEISKNTLRREGKNLIFFLKYGFFFKLKNLLLSTQ
jgi:hypothetical protein